MGIRERLASEWLGLLVLLVVTGEGIVEVLKQIFVYNTPPKPRLTFAFLNFSHCAWLIGPQAPFALI